MTQRSEAASPHRRARGVTLRAFLVIALTATGMVVSATDASAAGEAITVTPNTGLVDGQSVRVDGSGWQAGHDVVFCEVASPALVSSCLSPGTTADDAGNFSVDVAVERYLNLSTGGQIDCADPANQCFLTAAYFADQVDAQAQLFFGSNTPDTLIVTPNTALRDGQQVRVDGFGWVPRHQIGFCEAVDVEPASASNCGSGAYSLATADTVGNFTGTLTLARVISVPSLGHDVDCANPATPCVIGAADVADLAGTVQAVTLGFAPPGPPTAVPGVASALEGNAGTTNLDVPVTLSNASKQTVTVQWRTVAVTGAPGNQADPTTDYTLTIGTLTFAPGATTGTVTIKINGDTLVEPDEYIVVQFGGATNAKLGGFYGLGFAIITNDDHATVVPGVASALEGNAGTTNLDVPVTLSNASTQTVTVQWRTVAVTGAPGNQADPTTDYTLTIGTLTFAPGATTGTVTIKINGDTLVEPDEYIVVQFGGATNAKLGGFYGLGFAIITNDD